MTLEKQRGIEVRSVAGGRRAGTEMHLFDEAAEEENVLCGAVASFYERRSVSGYLEDRLNDIGVGIVCEGCKSRTVPFAVRVARHLEAGGPLEEADAHRQIAGTLLREAGRDRSGD